jgi:hypothetical protein
MQVFPRQTEEALAFWGVRWFLDDSAHLQFDFPVLASEGRLTLQEVPGAVPWVRLVESWQVGGGLDDELQQTIRLIRSSAWRDKAILDREPVWAGGPAPGVPTAAGIAWLDSRPDRWTWDVDATKPAILVALMNGHPGWRASVDGEVVPLMRAYGGFLAVALSPGRHRVELAFRDPWLSAGAWITGLSWVLVLFGALWWMRQGRGRHSGRRDQAT